MGCLQWLVLVGTVEPHVRAYFEGRDQDIKEVGMHVGTLRVTLEPTEETGNDFSQSGGDMLVRGSV